jgi:hypothetical protein
MINATQEVSEFIRVFDASTDIALWERLVEEELLELHVELTADNVNRENVLKETADVIYVVTPLVGIVSELSNIGLVSEERITKLQDIIERVDVKLATSIAMFGEDTITEAVKLVHASNMSKLDDSGKPVRREDGKILKSKNYVAPDLSVVARPQ